MQLFRFFTQNEFAQNEFATGLERMHFTPKEIQKIGQWQHKKGARPGTQQPDNKENRTGTAGARARPEGGQQRGKPQIGPANGPANGSLLTH